jgi:tetratricopeptide (TPR) repeat protein
MKQILSQAQALVERHAYDEAVEMLMPFFEKREKGALFYFLLGTCFLETGDSANAVRFLEKAVEIDPQEKRYILSLKRAYKAFGEPEKVKVLKEAERKETGMCLGV